MLSLLVQNPLQFIIVAGLLVVAISVHEFSHAFAADNLGDPTPRAAGRLTLDPRAHLDPIGSLLLLIVGFGWGRPVPFDPFNLKDTRRDAAIISFAGPLSNTIMAIAASILIRIFLLIPIVFLSVLLVDVLSLFIYFNILLAIFNLIPIHPLDGFKVVAGVLPKKYYYDWMELERYGMIFLILLIFPFFGVSPIVSFIMPIIRTIVGFLIPGSVGGII